MICYGHRRAKEFNGAPGAIKRQGLYRGKFSRLSVGSMTDAMLIREAIVV